MGEEDTSVLLTGSERLALLEMAREIHKSSGYEPDGDDYVAEILKIYGKLKKGIDAR